MFGDMCVPMDFVGSIYCIFTNITSVVTPKTFPLHDII